MSLEKELTSLLHYDVTLFAEEVDHALIADQVSRAPHHDDVPVTGEQFFDLCHPRMIAVRDHLFGEVGKLLETLE